jgi:hypothetical protein
MNTKGADWGYEKEWRVVTQLSECQQKSSSLFVKPLDPDCIKAIFLGAAVSSESKHKIMSLLKPYSHVTQLQARLDSLGFGLIFDHDLENNPVGAFRPKSGPRRMSLDLPSGRIIEGVHGGFILRDFSDDGPQADPEEREHGV